MNEEFYLIEVACWDNENPPGDPPPVDDPPADPPKSGKTFTQEEVDKFVTKRNKTLRTQYEQLEKNYETLLEQTNMSAEQRERLEADLENVRAQMRTKEQQLNHEKKQATEKFQKELKAAQEQSTYYKTLFESSTIERAITDAASRNDGYDASQFVGLLRDKAKVVEELDNEGNKTGRLVPRIEWEVVDPETKQAARVLKAPNEVIELMKEDVSRYGNLFKSNVARGLGQGQANHAGARGKIDVKKLSQAEYRELRKTREGRVALGLER